jgi:hypothetical protein
MNPDYVLFAFGFSVLTLPVWSDSHLFFILSRKQEQLLAFVAYTLFITPLKDKITLDPPFNIV